MHYARLIAIVIALTVTAATADAASFTHPHRGYRVSYPDAWSISLGFDGTLFLMSVPPGPTPGRGTLPVNTAEISIRVIDESDAGTGALEQLRTMGSEVRSTMVLRRCVADRLEQSFESHPPAVDKRIALACRIAGKQFLYVLGYYAHDPNARQWEQVLADVVESTRFLDPPTPGS